MLVVEGCGEEFVFWGGFFTFSLIAYVERRASKAQRGKGKFEI